VIVGFAWKLILSPLWGVAPSMLDAVGLKSLFAPWLGKEEYALTTLALVSVWQFVGIPMMLIYAALLSIPDEILEAAECDGIYLIYATQGALAGPNYSTDILGTLMFRTFFGFQLQLGDPNMGSTIASAMFLIILIGVSLYLFGIQTRLRRYQF
jgi:raffinose/stachyose/melibiose transport system permease protein